MRVDGGVDYVPRTLSNGGTHRNVERFLDRQVCTRQFANGVAIVDLVGIDCVEEVQFPIGAEGDTGTEFAGFGEVHGLVKRHEYTLVTGRASPGSSCASACGQGFLPN